MISKILKERYLAPGETKEQMFRRVANTVAEIDYRQDAIKLSDEFYDMMVNGDFLPNSPTLMNAGRDGILSACFVLPVEDSMESIFETIKNTALIHKQGGGTGFSFSRLRPKGDIVKSTNGVASGPVSFMKVFDAATEAVKQGGKRRGANMGCLRVDHPDILEFIKCKENTSQITNFNISVALTDDFMTALEQGKDYPLINPRTGEETGKLSAERVFNTICQQAWLTGEPGAIFIDEMNRHNTTPNAGMFEATNPCGEQNLLPYESCNLGSINIGNMVIGKKIDFKKLEKTVKLAVRFLDNVIDVNEYILEEIEEATLSNRRIGLGVMGFADMLIKMGIPYNSKQGIRTAEEVMGFINNTAWQQSVELAKEKHVFYNWRGQYFNWAKVRNATVTTIAPTGTISMIAGCSSGIEPLFAIAYKHNVLSGSFEVNKLFMETAKERGFYSDDLIERIIKNHGSVQGLKGVPDDVQRLFVTAHDISPKWHVDIQAAFQKYTDNAVSKTINLPNDATVEDVKEAYLRAHETGCKGITVYRDGSRRGQPLEVQSNPEEVKKPRTRPTKVEGTTEKIKIGCGTLYVTVNHDDQGMCEVFTATGKAGGCPAQSEATARLISLALRSGIEPQQIARQLKGIRCLSTVAKKDVNVLSCPDAIGRCLEGYEEKRETGCPECGGKLEYSGGCAVCLECGYSKCG